MNRPRIFWLAFASVLLAVAGLFLAGSELTIILSLKSGRSRRVNRTPHSSCDYNVIRELDEYKDFCINHKLAFRALDSSGFHRFSNVPMFHGSHSFTPPDLDEVLNQARRTIPESVIKALIKLRVRLHEETVAAQWATGRSRPFAKVAKRHRGRAIVKQMANNAYVVEYSIHNTIKSLKIPANKSGVDCLSEILSPLRPNNLLLDPDDPIPILDSDVCPYPDYNCRESKYRTFDGSCNNLLNPLWGKSFVPLRRLVEADYGDGLDSPRLASDGSPLPNARSLSFKAHNDEDHPAHFHTILLMQLGQFIDHDLSLTAITKLQDETSGESVDVECGDDGCSEDAHPACFPIFIPPGDPAFVSKECLEFVRSEPVPNIKCKIGPREQVSQITSYIDASNVYGSTKEDADALRELSNSRGRLQMSSHPQGAHFKETLQHSHDDSMCLKKQSLCYKAGDDRANEQTGLTAFHTIWNREHNRIEEQLHALRPEWDGETLFQETRRIVGALLQNIAYGEFLPTVLGPIVMERYGLSHMKNGYYKGYDETIDATISNEFATAAYRFGHSLLIPIFKRLDKNYNEMTSLHLSEIFFKPSLLTETSDGIDGFLRGLCKLPMQKADKHFSKEASTMLFPDNPPHGLGTDLVALNIQRGRDHGIPGYNSYRSWCGLATAQSFDDLQDIKDPTIIASYTEHYKHVDDIDLFSAGLAEEPTEGSLLGPTFSCILGREFARLKRGDRYWFENRGLFTLDQLREIKKVKLSKVLCTNSDGLHTIQPDVLQRPFREAFPRRYYDDALEYFSEECLNELWDQNYNARVDCSCLPQIDLSAWGSG